MRCSAAADGSAKTAKPMPVNDAQPMDRMVRPMLICDSLMRCDMEMHRRVGRCTTRKDDPPFYGSFTTTCPPRGDGPGKANADKTEGQEPIETFCKGRAFVRAGHASAEVRAHSVTDRAGDRGGARSLRRRTIMGRSGASAAPDARTPDLLPWGRDGVSGGPASSGAFVGRARGDDRAKRCGIDATTPRRVPCAAQAAGHWWRRRRPAPVSVSAAPDESARRSCGCRCRCSWCSGTTDREVISPWFSPFRVVRYARSADTACKTYSVRPRPAKVQGLSSVQGPMSADECKAVRQFVPAPPRNKLCSTVPRSRHAARPPRRMVAPDRMLASDC